MKRQSNLRIISRGIDYSWVLSERPLAVENLSRWFDGHDWDFGSAHRVKDENLNGSHLVTRPIDGSPFLEEKHLGSSIDMCPRLVPSDNNMSKDKDSHTDKEPRQIHVQRSQPFTRTRLAGALLAVSVIWSFNRAGKLLPEEYTLCSESKNIYTVDEANPRVECIRVRDSRILDIGSSGIVIWLRIREVI